MARLVVSAAVGIAVGYFLGPTAGLQAFTVTYGATGFLDPKQKVVGPRLDDLKAPRATYGAPIAYIEGAPRGAWNIMWASDKRAIANTTESGGKGGPGVESTTYTYEMDVFYLCAINRCQAVRRIWSNGKLVWSNADDADAETIVASSQTNSWRDIRFYDGNPDQLPDPTYEAAVGVGNAPAYRGRTSIFIESLNLGGSGQLPVLTFEIVSEASTDWTATQFANFELSSILDTTQFLSGVSAMNPAGFDFLYGTGYDAFNSGHTGYNVYHVDAGGTITLTGIIDYDGSVGGGTGKEGTAIQGNTDVSLLMVYEFDPAFIPHLDFCTAYFADGSHTQFAIPITASAGGQVFSKRGNRFAFISDNTSAGYDKKLRVFNSAGGLIATSVPMALGAQFIAIGDGVVYVLSGDPSTNAGDDIYVLDLETATLVDTITTPYTAIQAAIACDEDGNLYLFGLGTIPDPYPIYKWDGVSWTRIIANEPLLYSGLSSRHAYYAATDVLATQRFLPDGPPNHEGFFIAVTRTAIVEPTLDQVVRRLCLRTGQLTDDDIDVTDLSHDVLIADGLVRAMAITSATSTRATIEMLMASYLFEAVEEDKIRFVRRGGAKALTIPYDDLGASERGDEEPLPLKRLNDPEVAARVSVKYMNVLNDDQDGLEQADRLVTPSTAEMMVEVPLGFEPTDAARLAQANTMDQAVSLVQIGPVAVSRKYSALQPTDVIGLVDLYGDEFRARIVKATTGSGRQVLELVLDDATAIVAVSETDSDYVSSTLVRALATTDLELLDIPILRDADDGPGFYAAFGATGRWPGAELDSSLDDVSYEKVVVATDVAVMGTASTTLGDFTDGNVFDEVNSLMVDVGAGELSSTTRTLLLTGTGNALLVGSEIIQFRSASLVSPGVYTLTGFLRGRRGTEWAMPGHAANERVVLLQTTGLRHIDDELADLNISKYWKAVTFGQRRADVDPQTFADTGVGLMPFAPTDVRLLDGVATWHRRSRLSSRFLQTTPVALGETSESYAVELRDASDVLVESATVTSPTYTLVYGGSLTGYTFTVWQNSAFVGRGYPATLEL